MTFEKYLKEKWRKKVWTPSVLPRNLGICTITGWKAYTCALMSVCIKPIIARNCPQQNVPTFWCWQGMNDLLMFCIRTVKSNQVSLNSHVQYLYCNIQFINSVNEDGRWRCLLWAICAKLPDDHSAQGYSILDLKHSHRVNICFTVERAGPCSP